MEIVPDDHARLVDVLESQLLRADLLVTTGGISYGSSDVVRTALSELGTVEFHDIAMDPGRFQGFGTPMRASSQASRISMRRASPAW